MLTRTKKGKKRKLCSSLVCNSVSSFDLHSLYIAKLLGGLFSQRDKWEKLSNKVLLRLTYNLGILGSRENHHDIWRGGVFLDLVILQAHLTIVPFFLWQTATLLYLSYSFWAVILSTKWQMSKMILGRRLLLNSSEKYKVESSWKCFLSWRRILFSFQTGKFKILRAILRKVSHI